MPRPLDCPQVLDRLEAYVDGDLDEMTAAAFTAHLAGCPECAAEHRLAADIRSELRALPAFDAPPAVLREVLHRAGAERFRPPPRRQSPAWTAVAAAALAAVALVAVLIGGGIFLSRQTAAPEAPETELAQADPEEIARATEEARLAFAHVARVSRQAGFQVREDLGEHLVAASANSLRRALFPARKPETETEGSDPQADRS